MRRSRLTLLAVLLAIVVVIIAKNVIEERRAGASGAQSAAVAPAAEGRPVGPLPGSALDGALKSGRPTMADFGKEWCVPCKMMVPVLKQAAQDFQGKANIVFVNLEEYADLGGQDRIATMPTQVVFDAKGKEVTRHLGFMGGEDLEKQLAALGAKP